MCNCNGSIAIVTAVNEDDNYLLIPYNEQFYIGLLVVAGLNSTATLAQAYALWQHKEHVQVISSLHWTCAFIVNVMWVIWGMMKALPIIIFTSGFSVLTSLLVLSFIQWYQCNSFLRVCMRCFYACYLRCAYIQPTVPSTQFEHVPLNVWNR
jgi:hypothetical protein